MEHDFIVDVGEFCLGVGFGLTADPVKEAVGPFPGSLTNPLDIAHCECAVVEVFEPLRFKGCPFTLLGCDGQA